MKKFTLFVLVAGFTLSVFAQERIAIPSGVKLQKHDFPKAIDTLAPMSYATGDLTWYITFCGITPEPADTGYVCGPNCYSDMAKAQQFIYESVPYNLTGCLVWVAKHRGNEGDLIFNVYGADGTGTAVSGTVTYAPGTILSTVTMPYSQMNSDTSFAGGMNYFELTTPLAITYDYYVGLDFSSMGAYPANSFAIVSSTDGDGGFTEMSWEKWSDNTWFSFLEDASGWGLDFDMMFFPIINDVVSVQEHYINNVVLNMFPNPVSEEATIQYKLKNSAKEVNIGIFDLTGKSVMDFEQGAMSAGSYTLNFDASALTAGTYIYVIQADRNRLAKKFIVE